MAKGCVIIRAGDGADRIIPVSLIPSSQWGISATNLRLLDRDGCMEEE
jgi:hypothetical protein